MRPALVRGATRAFLVGVAVVAVSLTTGSAATTGPEIPTILQQVRIGDVPLLPDTGMTPPIALVHPLPSLTAEAIDNGIEGTVTVRAEFDIDGNFEVLEVVKGLGYGLDEAAMAALGHWTVRPAYRNGRRVAVVANVDVEFRMPRAVSPVVVSIAADETIFLNEEPADASALVEQLRGIFETLPDRTVFIKADRQAAWRSVVRVIAIARAAGIDRIGLTTETGQ